MNALPLVYGMEKEEPKHPRDKERTMKTKEVTTTNVADFGSRERGLLNECSPDCEAE